MTNYVGVVPPYYSGILNSLNAYAIFKFAVFLMNEAFFKHGEREALRSCIKALNFWATEICWELQDYTLNKLKGIEDELIVNMSAKSSFRILNLLSFCRGELQDFVLNKSKGIEDELIIKLKSAIIEVADGDGDDEYSLLVDLNRLYELQLSRQISIESLHKDLAETLKNFRSIDDEVCVVFSEQWWLFQESNPFIHRARSFGKRAKTTPHLCKLVIIAVGKLVAADAVPKAADGVRIVGASRIIGVDLNASRFEQAKKFGVTQFVNPKDYSKPVQEVIAEMTDGGVDRSVECTGHIDAMIPAFECVHDVWVGSGCTCWCHKEALEKAFVASSPWRAKLTVLEKDLLASRYCLRASQLACRRVVGSYRTLPLTNRRGLKMSSLSLKSAINEVADDDAEYSLLVNLKRLSSSGKRWRICSLGRRFKPHTMQSETQYLSGTQGLALVEKGGGFVASVAGSSPTPCKAKPGYFSILKSGTIFIFLISKRSALFDLLESFLTTKSSEGCVLFSEQWLFRKATLVSSTELEALGSYGPEESGCPQWIRWDKLELGSERTELGGWLSYGKYSLENYVFTGLKRIPCMLLEEELSAELSDEDATNLIRLLFASTRKADLEKIVPASDNKKKYYTKAQKDVFEISKRDITISMMRNYPQLPHKFMSDKAKIHHLLEIIVHMNLERDSLKRQDQNFTSAVLLKKKAFLKHGVKEALRSRVKALNFCAT
ncbi:hypothetical protein MTR67_048022 [Solanum verrucosum]|uniref:Uncharacterized protein n=2 Tax=Solanum TaxID=4107 RepID=A0AAF0UXP7_SOLVR|nr:hypothetical protein MTR67_048022 [Solanum verrucosum]